MRVVACRLAIWTAIAGIGFPLLAKPAWAGRTFHVAKQGADSNPGTETQPWLTIGKAAETLVAGDTVYIQAGIYHERLVPKNSGTASQYITYATYPGHEVTLDGTGIAFSWAGLVQITGKDGIKLSGIRVENSACFGVLVSGNSSHIVIEKNRFRNCQSSGIRLSARRPATAVTDVLICGNEVTETNFNGNQEGISLCGVERFEVRNNHVHHIHKEGIDAKDGCTHGKIRGNYVHHMLGFRQASGTIVSTVGIYVDTYGHTLDIEVCENVVHNCGAGFAVASETGDPCENIRFVNNVSYHNVNGFVLGWEKVGPKNIAFINNVAYANQSTGIAVTVGNVENVVVRNNICSRNGEAQISVRDPKRVIVDHNLIDGYRSARWVLKDDAWKEFGGDNVIGGNPMFVNPVGGDFHLKPGSPAIGKGSAVDAPDTDCEGNPRPKGAGVDLGAYQAKSDAQQPSSAPAPDSKRTER